ncbi:MAG: carbohydrate kinase family protein [Tepidanaerobacteraceae bacterium]|nr:carbohydrate kinase family protein [Tepidanaerobacteraceae bacterium]
MAGNKILVMGGIIIDSYIIVNEYPQKGQDTFITNCFERVGGCAINVANTLKNLGCKPYIISAIGNDPKGITIYKYLKNRGFGTRFVKPIKGKMSGYCITILDGQGERTFLTYKGCETIFERDMVERNLATDIPFVYLTGYFLLDNRFYSDILETLDQLKSSGSRILFDPGPLLEHIDSKMLTSILKRTDVLVPNKSELAKIRNMLNMDDNFNKWAFKNGIAFILEKQGSNGVKVWTQEDNFYIPSYKVNSIDTSGAGDSFAGGLIYCLINGCKIKQAVDFSSACGAITTTFKGPHGIFDITTVKQLMQNRKEIFDVR